MFFSWLSVLLLYLFSAQIKGANTPKRRITTQTVLPSAAVDFCSTPGGTSGTCIIIKSCPQLYSLLKVDYDLGSSNSATTQLLRNSKCGTEGTNPKVCCPIVGVLEPQEVSRSGIVQKSPATDNAFSECGISTSIQNKIIGGDNAIAGDWPWMVALKYKSNVNGSHIYGCGGSLISNKWVITSAHCIIAVGYKLVSVRVGDVNLDDKVSDGVTPIETGFDAVFIHPQYKADSTKRAPHDIAIIRLQKVITFTKHIRPICLLNETQHIENEFYEKYQPFVIGWGLKNDKNRPDNLQVAQLKIVNNKKCEDQYSPIQMANIDDSVICAAELGKDTCYGDSGGPLMIPYKSTIKFFLAGITSYGVGCNRTETFPGLYTKIAYYGQWINNVTSKYNF